MKWIQHVAGDMSPEGVQVCTRCGEVITDYRGAMVLDGTPPLRGWKAGPVWTTGTNPKTWMAADPRPEYDWKPCGERVATANEAAPEGTPGR